MISLGVAEWAWRILYWSTFVLAWVLLPVVYEYQLAGDFSVGSKLRTAVIANCRIYLLYGLLIGSFVCWCTAHHATHTLPSTIRHPQSSAQCPVPSAQCPVPSICVV